MSDKPLVSVIIANHGYSRYVKDAILSVNNDDYPNKQICILDDGSLDDSVNVIFSLIQNPKSWSKNGIQGVEGEVGGTKIIFIAAKPAKGPSSARNLAIKAVWDETEIFIPLDADDQFLAAKITRSVEKILQGKGKIGGAYTDYCNIDELGCKKVQYKESFSRQRLLQECIVHSSCAFTKEAISKVGGGYNEKLRVAEDYDLWLKISEHYMISHIPEILMNVRVHKNNSTNQVNKEIWEKCLSIVFNDLNERNHTK